MSSSVILICCIILGICLLQVLVIASFHSSTLSILLSMYALFLPPMCVIEGISCCFVQAMGPLQTALGPKTLTSSKRYNLYYKQNI